MALSPPVASRAVRIAVVVGTILVAINQGEAMVTGEFTAKTAVQITLTYVVALPGIDIRCRRGNTPQQTRRT